MPQSSKEYTAQVLKVVVAQICQKMGFTSVQSTSMEVMQNLLDHYMREMAKLTKDYGELFNRTDPNVNDVAMAYRAMKVEFSDLKEYMEFVDPIECAIAVPKYPLPKESHLNFLKPGSQEVITRPTHIPEYLPPMQPPEEDEEPIPVVTTEEVVVEETVKEELTSPTLFKKPDDAFRKFKFDEEGKPTRDLSSVMMTSSGFISPAREGKLPDSKMPVIVPDRRPSPPPPPPVAAPLPVTNIDNKFEEKPPKKKHEEKKSKKIPKKEISAAVAGPSTANSGPPKVLPPIPPHSIASTVTPSLPPIVKAAAPVTPRKPGRPPKPRPDGTPAPVKPKKPKNPEAKALLKEMKKQMAAGLLPQMPESQLMDMVRKFAENQKPAQPPTQPPLSQPFAAPQFGMPPKIEGKLLAEPDKSKLHIFKKMPSAKPPPLPAQEFGTPVMVPKIEPSEEITPPPRKREALEAPLNMALGKSPIEMSLPKTPEFMPRTPDVKQSPWMKEEKERKKKEKPEKKSKKYQQNAAPPMMPYYSQYGLGGMNPMSFAGTPSRYPFFQNLIPSGPGLIPTGPGLIPSGPGLIPTNSFMNGPSFGTPSMSSFGLPSASLGGSGLFPGLQSRMRDEPPIVDQIPIFPEKPQCNVAPLLPQKEVPSTSRHTTPAPVRLSPILKLPPDTVAIPVHDPPMVPEVPPAAPEPGTDEFDTIDLTSPVSSKSEKKKDKEHKKEKKDKDKLKKKKKQKDKDRERGEKEPKEKVKKHKKEKKKDKERHESHKVLSSNTDSVDASDSSMASVPKLTLKLGGLGGSRSSTPDVLQPKKISMKPGGSKKKDSDSVSDTFSDIGSSPRATLARESSPELAKISALITHPPKKRSRSPKKRKHEDDVADEKPPTKHKKHSPPVVQMPVTAATAQKPTSREEEGQKVWICPACAQVDNGTPMIGCDGCDAWYHWVCVGIQVPPDENEDWYCRACISKKRDSHGEKKKKRKKNKERGEKP